MRGRKKPGMPNQAPAIALHWFDAARSPQSIGTLWLGPDDTNCQNSFSRATRWSGALPAINAALIAPIETPATQSSLLSLSSSGSNTPAWYAPRAPPPCSTSAFAADSIETPGGLDEKEFG